MGISSSSPGVSSNLRVLGSGTFTTGSTGTMEDVGNFTTLGDTGNSKIIIKMEVLGTIAGNLDTAIHNAAGNAYTLSIGSDTAAGVSPLFSEFTLSKSFNDLNAAYAQVIRNGVTTSVCKTITTAAFVLSAAEQIFLKVNANVVSKGTWIAYQIYP